MKLFSILGLVILISCQSAISTGVQSSETLPYPVGKMTIAKFKEVAQWAYYVDPGYTPDEVDLGILKNELADATFSITIGAWCGDSKEQLPRFFKILDLCGIDYSNWEINLVSRDRKSWYEATCDSLITHVPTIIFYKSGKELGRINELPKTTIERDLVTMLFD